MSLSDLLDDPPEELVVSDTRTWSCTEIKVYNRVFTWIIKNFPSLPMSTNVPNVLNSHPFAAGTFQEHVFILRIYPMGKQNGDRNHVGLYLGLLQTVNELFVKFKISFMNSDDIVVETRSTNGTFYAETFVGWSRFISRDRLFDKDKVDLKDGELHIKCEIWFSNGDTYTTAPYNTYINSSSGDVNPPSITPDASMSRDLENLMTSQAYCDLKLIVEGEPINAHRDILSARSPTFAAMLEQMVEQPEHDKLELPGLKRIVADALLRFIYTGSPGHVSSEILEDLLIAAENFALSRLKIICEDMLISEMTIDNSSNMLMLAEDQNCKHLKEHAVSYIAANRKYVKCSDSWNTLVNTKPNLVLEIIKYSSSNNSSQKS